jgi:hypothetical protein
MTDAERGLLSEVDRLEKTGTTLATENRRLQDMVNGLSKGKNEALDENRRLRAQIRRDEEYLAFLIASDHVHKESVHLVENYRNAIKADNSGLFP